MNSTDETNSLCVRAPFWCSKQGEGAKLAFDFFPFTHFHNSNTFPATSWSGRARELPILPPSLLFLAVYWFTVGWIHIAFVFLDPGLLKKAGECGTLDAQDPQWLESPMQCSDKNTLYLISAYWGANRDGGCNLRPQPPFSMAFRGHCNHNCWRIGSRK